MNTNPLRERELYLTRRQLFGKAALGLGTAAMAQLTPSWALANADSAGADRLSGPVSPMPIMVSCPAITMFLHLAPAHLPRLRQVPIHHGFHARR